MNDRLLQNLCESQVLLYISFKNIYISKREIFINHQKAKPDQQHLHYKFLNMRKQYPTTALFNLFLSFFLYLRISLSARLYCYRVISPGNRFMSKLFISSTQSFLGVNIARCVLYKKVIKKKICFIIFLI